ncbi:MAG: hypothetical protein A2204_05615 [Elusimicrobia bacterium RIFOXYA1_FULL_47_7]|nr:MAG: hypothetical protein A2278_05455 [Elusimicrobia bacterium RIFOXYA12_FULL_49_49]OGS09741.1 MAG: hypothetical protein A2204_05615 [Elusimicrobia bacterium RIFOXYA1_FULL_47_7]OGS16477.1 MAG: hypothetical protein A2251_06605 [Elusimicrobia bacterium RIFOXYA2_FULL_47_53]OGS26669.1 MAG: hypothetical protein A2339_01820 [Elusimicrobia bacterium RIFOXYB12_FULL_50_12]OGS31214.1 MAG: hypothetical protein A2323_00890 [Elusimicrobia bacterium RIFOXYB2_FULL_46_23]
MRKFFLLSIPIFILLNSLAGFFAARPVFSVPAQPQIESGLHRLSALADLPGRMVEGLIKSGAPLFPEFRQPGKASNSNDFGKASKYSLAAPSSSYFKLIQQETSGENAGAFTALRGFAPGTPRAHAPPGFAFVFLLIYFVMLRRGNLPADAYAFFSFSRR